MRIKSSIKLLLIASLGLGAVALLGYYALPWCFHLPEHCLKSPPESAQYSREGVFLGFVADAQHYRQQPLPEGVIPPMVQRALLAAEDRRFFTHGGIDARAVGRALSELFSAGSVQSGASTLSMQLVKMSLPQAERTLSHKLYECLLARHMEMCYSKEEILRGYLNHADFGQLSRGIETAARLYFNKSAKDLNAAESALLVAQLKSPTRYNPFQYPERAKAARNRILITMGEGASCVQELGLQPAQAWHAPHLNERVGRLSISIHVQRELSRIIEQEVAQLRAQNVQQAAALIVDNETGEVLASVASADWEDPRGGQIDGTSVKRSAGSTLKPFVYLLALEAGQNPSTVYADIPTRFPSAEGIDAPRNYNEHYLGPISMRVALACSQNIPAMLALNEHGGEKMLLAKLKLLGYELPEGAYGLGLAIGNAHVNLKEQTAAFSCLARGGAWLPLRFDCVQQQAVRPSPQQLIQPAHAWQLSMMLADASARLAGFGMAPALRFPFPCAVKTGTSSNFRDNWCVGYTKDYTVAVWVGNFDNSAMQEVSGLTGAGPIFHRAMSYLHEYGQPQLQARPEGMQLTSLDPRSGSRGEGAQEWLTSEQLEQLPEAAATDAQGRVLLPIEYRDWLAAQGAAVHAQFALDPEATLGRAARIINPASGVTLFIDLILPNEGRKLPLSSTLNPDRSHWSSDSLHIFKENGRWYAWLEAGPHQIEVRDPQSGARTTSYFTVEE